MLSFKCILIETGVYFLLTSAIWIRKISIYPKHAKNLGYLGIRVIKFCIYPRTSDFPDYTRQMPPSPQIQICGHICHVQVAMTAHSFYVEKT